MTYLIAEIAAMLVGAAILGGLLGWWLGLRRARTGESERRVVELETLMGLRDEEMRDKLRDIAVLRGQVAELEAELGLQPSHR